jgi:DNA-binding NarL/FixJ family response regulator
LSRFFKAASKRIGNQNSTLIEIMRIRIAILEYNKTVLNDILSILKNDLTLEIVRTFDHVTHCINDVKFGMADIILIGIAKHDINGVNDIKLLKEKYPHVQILVYTALNDDQIILEAIHAGISGYILKSTTEDELTGAIKELRNGGSPISPLIARRLMMMMQKNTYGKPRSPEKYNLTNREKQILHCIKEGLSYKMIVHHHRISYSTVRSHIQSIYKKLDVASLTELVGKTIRENL